MSRAERRKHHKPTKKPVPLHRRKSKVREMNKGGFYEGMPGCVIDSNGNRSMIHFVVTPEGISTAYMNAHPNLSATCLKSSMSNQMIRHIVLGATFDYLFKSKNPLNWPLKIRLRIQRYFLYLRSKRIANKNERKNLQHEQ